jgi:exodeoxyribonuclease VIII
MKIDFPSIRDDLLNDEYHGTKAIGNSGLKKLLHNPAQYRYEQENPPSPTRAMQIGTWTHSAVLEPDLFKDTYYKMPEGDKRKKEYKELAAESALNHPGKEGIDATLWDQFMGMRDSVYKHLKAAELLSYVGWTERSYFWMDEGKVPCKCRPDRQIANEFVVDLKTCEDASPQGFAKASANWGYHIQQAFYMRGLEAAGAPVKEFIFVAVEKAKPYTVGVYTLDAAALAHGQAKVQDGLDIFQECIETCTWPGYSDDMLELSLPGWCVPRDKPAGNEIRALNSVRIDPTTDLSLDDAAMMAGVSRNTIYNWCNKGLASRPRNPNAKRSPKIIKVADLETYISNG